MSSPPPTPSSALPRLNANSSAFVPGGSAPPKKITLKNVDGTEVNIETLKSPLPPTLAIPTVRQNVPVTPTRKTGTVRIETPEQRQKRLEEEEQKEKSKADAEEKARQEKEEEVKKKRDEEERKKKEEEQERIRKEEERLRQEEKERLRKEEQERERLRKEEEERERLRKEEEEKQRLRKEEEERERLKKEEEEEKERLRQEAEEKDRQRKEEEDRQRREDEEKERKEEAERIRIEEEKAREEEERLKKEAEDRRQQEEEEADKAKTAAEDEAEPEVEVEGIKMTDSPATPEPEEGELPLSKDDIKEKSAGSLRIDTTLRRRPGPLDLSHSRQPSSPLTLARPLENLGSVTYPAGISSPNPELNAGAKEGKFRYVDRKSCAAVVNSHSFADTIATFCCNSCPFARKNQNLFLLWMRLA